LTPNGAESKIQAKNFIKSLIMERQEYLQVFGTYNKLAAKLDNIEAEVGLLEDELIESHNHDIGI
jgi:hypothetical protein